MNEKLISTDSYKGVRDFYPVDAAIQHYIFSTWARTAESFGYERYDASILEPSDLYKAKGAQNEEMVNEQTYTFIDRGEREVTLRPEMTPTVARMVAGKRRELSFPLRWYSIPNLFRYERPQRGRLREHWQLNCDIFGTNDYTADVEVIALAYQCLIDFGAKPDMFEIQINDRQLMTRVYQALGVKDDQVPAITRLNDRRDKINAQTYRTELKAIVGDGLLVEEIIMMLDSSDEQTDMVIGLAELGITNVVFNKSLARGFDYYTGTIFEVRDTAADNNRALLGGGRYDNLTGMFGGEAIPGVGFGFGDVTMRDFLETHNLLPTNLNSTSATITIIPFDTEQNLAAQKVAAEIRAAKINVTVDIGTKKVGKKIGDASDKGSKYIIVIGENEVAGGVFVLKNLASGEESSGSIQELITTI